eukprot:jgi/Bigna1/134182/aug1.24_g8890
MAIHHLLFAVTAFALQDSLDTQGRVELEGEEQVPKVNGSGAFARINGVDVPLEQLLSPMVITMEKRRNHVIDVLHEINMFHFTEIRNATTPSQIQALEVIPDAQLNRGERACSVSHSRCYRHFLDTSDKPYGMVFEDDFQYEVEALDGEPASMIPQMIADAITAKESGKANWEVLNLGRCNDCCRTCQHEVSELPNFEGLKIVQSNSAYCGTAYLFNRKGAAAMRKVSFPVSVISDDSLVAVGRGGWANYMSMSPKLFSQDRVNFGSDIHDIPPEVECDDFSDCNSHCESGVPEDEEDGIVVETGTPVYLPKLLHNKIELPKANLSRFMGYVNSASSQCSLSRKMKLSSVAKPGETASAIATLVKPMMHALKFGYCVETPVLAKEDSCNLWGEFLEPFGSPASKSLVAETAEKSAFTLAELEDKTDCATAFSKPAMGDSAFEKCLKQYSFKSHGGEALSKSHKTLGFFRGVTAMMAYLTRPTKSLSAHIDAVKKELEWPQSDILALSVHKGASFAEYMKQAERITKQYGIKNIFLATDDESLIAETKNYPKYKFIVEKKAAAAASAPCDSHKKELTRLFLLSASDALVGDFSFATDRVAYGMMYQRTRTHNPYISLNGAWCSDHGVKSRVHVNDGVESYGYC